LLLESLLLLWTELTLATAGVGWAHGWSVASPHPHSVVHAVHSTLLHIHHLLHHLGVHALHVAHVRVRAVPSLHLLLLLHHLHHLHLLRIHTHVAHAAHAAHAAHHVGGHLLLHHGEVLLHSLPVLGHHLRGHAGIVASHHVRILVGCILCGLVIVVASKTFVSPKFSPPTTSTKVIFFTHLTSRLSTLDLDGLAENLQRVELQALLHGRVTVERDKSEASRSAGVLVHHQRCVDDPTELCEESLEIFLGCLLADTTNEDFGGLFLLVSGDGTLGVDLGTIE
jgi:hypothetical protein